MLKFDFITLKEETQLPSSVLNILFVCLTWGSVTSLFNNSSGLLITYIDR